MSSLSEQLYQTRALPRLPGGFARSTLFASPFPRYAESGTGARVTDVDGHTVLDAQNNYTSLIHGHKHPDVTHAIADAAAQLVSIGMPTIAELDLADELASRIVAAPRWIFTNSGTEAVMFAIRLARAATGRDRILRFAGAYHGSHEDVLAPGLGLPASDRTAITVPFDDVEAFTVAVRTHRKELAAVVFDVMPNRAGLRPASQAFIAAVESETHRAGALLIQDEILTLRCGLGGLHARYGIRPDIVTAGKIIGGGLPIGAVGGGDIMDLFDPRRPESVDHAGTFTANPLTMRAGLAALQRFGQNEVDRLEQAGEHLRGELTRQGWKVTGLGSLFRIHVENPTRLRDAAYHHGVLLAGNGLGCLSTAMTDADVDEIASALGTLSPRGPTPIERKQQ